MEVGFGIESRGGYVSGRTPLEYLGYPTWARTRGPGMVLSLEPAKDAGRPLLLVRLKLDGDPSRRCAVLSFEANVCLHPSGCLRR